MNTFAVTWLRLIAYVFGIGELLANFRRNSRNIYSPSSQTQKEWPASLDSVFTSKTCLITGAERGIGAELAETLCLHGADVIFASRAEDETLQTIQRIQHRLQAEGRRPVKMIYVHLELTSLDSVRRAGQELQDMALKIDFVILNAGIFGKPLGQEQTRIITRDGFEEHFQVNHLSQWLLCHQIVGQQMERRNKLCKEGHLSHPIRVLVVASCAHTAGRLELEDINVSKHYSTFRAYANSKLATVLHVKQLQQLFDRQKDGEDTAVAIHPGVVRTNLAEQWLLGDDVFGKWFQPILEMIGRLLLPMLLISRKEAVQTILYAACASREEVFPTIFKTNIFWLARIGRRLSFIATQEALFRNSWTDLKRHILYHKLCKDPSIAVLSLLILTLVFVTPPYD